MKRFLLTTTLIAMVLAYGVVVLGAYVRLSDAGLGCPDWPGCYGRLVVPSTEQGIAEANAEFAHRPVAQDKAWKEMIHRYFASTLGMLILAVAALAWRARRNDPATPIWVPGLLVPLVVFQGVLGMWTVTLLLKPLVVTAHLIGGLMTLSLLWWTLLGLRWTRPVSRSASGLSRLAMWALVVIAMQITLGGWTSTNYAALACTDFPKCHGSWWPEMDFRDAFVLWRGLGTNYEYGVLDAPARVAVHFSHRLGALATTIVVILSAAAALRTTDGRLRFWGGLMLLALGIQIALGIGNVHYGLPLPVAVAHNAAAAALLLTAVALLFFSRRTDSIIGGH
jgi:cytochrome c oxidase assembly protein subunit 15